MEAPASSYTGSEATRSMVEKQIIERWGQAELESYDPFQTTRTFHGWLKLGFRVKKGEKALKSITYIESKDEKGNVIKKIKRPCFLFHYKQVEQVK